MTQEPQRVTDEQALDMLYRLNHGIVAGMYFNGVAPIENANHWLRQNLLDLVDERHAHLISRSKTERLLRAQNHGTACECTVCCEVDQTDRDKAYQDCDCSDKAESGCSNDCRL